jgi:hypothetical protein
MKMKVKIVGAVVGVVAVVGVAVTGVGLLREEKAEGPMRLVAVCIGEGTQTVGCMWIPLREELRTEAERELVARGVVKQ